MILCVQCYQIQGLLRLLLKVELFKGQDTHIIKHNLIGIVLNLHLHKLFVISVGILLKIGYQILQYKILFYLQELVVIQVEVIRLHFHQQYHRLGLLLHLILFLEIVIQMSVYIIIFGVDLVNHLQIVVQINKFYKKS